MAHPASIPGLNPGEQGTHRQGFVLAEVLVVALIIAALAAVAIPTYTSMIRSQRRDVTRNIAQTAAMSANVYARKFGLPATICNNTVNCSAKLGLYLPDPSRYSIFVQTDPNLVVVSDVSKGLTDSVMSSAGY